MKDAIGGVIGGFLLVLLGFSVGLALGSRGGERVRSDLLNEFDRERNDFYVNERVLKFENEFLRKDNERLRAIEKGSNGKGS